MANALDHLMWFVFYFVVYVGANLFLAMVFDKRVGNFWLWFFVFCLLPVAGYIFGFVYLAIYLPKKLKQLKRVVNDPALGSLLSSLQQNPERQISVTPFDTAGGAGSVTPIGDENKETSPEIGLDGKPIS